jgi:hypothetical protein
MSSIKTVAVVGVFVGVLATGAKAQREPALEEDGSARTVLELKANHGKASPRHR